jgi:hypothetical protein
MIDFKQMTDDEQTATAACEEWSNGEPAVTTQEEELSFKEGFKRGLRHERKKWQKFKWRNPLEKPEPDSYIIAAEEMERLIDSSMWWKSADGSELPAIDREVIALTNEGKVVFAHRPKESWQGKNIITGEVTTYYPERYGAGQWNIPDIKWWLDIEIPLRGE